MCVLPCREGDLFELDPSGRPLPRVMAARDGAGGGASSSRRRRETPALVMATRADERRCSPRLRPSLQCWSLFCGGGGDEAVEVRETNDAPPSQKPPLQETRLEQLLEAPGQLGGLERAACPRSGAPLSGEVVVRERAGGCREVPSSLGPANGPRARSRRLVHGQSGGEEEM